jgi:hypothetical protein
MKGQIQNSRTDPRGWSCGDEKNNSFIVDEQTEEVFFHEIQAPTLKRSSKNFTVQNIADALNKLGETACKQ